MKILSYIFIIFLLFISCTGSTIYEKPKDLISKDTMVALLTEMHIATSSKFMKTKNNQKDVNYMFLVYQKYGIDSLRFHNSNVYYASRIDEYSLLLNEAKKRLSEKAGIIQKQVVLEDSIAKIKNKGKGKKELLDERVREMHEEIELSEDMVETIKNAKNNKNLKKNTKLPTLPKPKKLKKVK